VAPIIERIDSGCASNPMRVLIRLTAPPPHLLRPRQIKNLNEVNHRN
jgi:hypothetical protein